MTSAEAPIPGAARTIWARPEWMLDKPLAHALDVVAKALALARKEGVRHALPCLGYSGSAEAQRHLAWACVHSEEVWALVLSGVRGYREMEVLNACDVLAGMLRAVTEEELAEVPWAPALGLELLRSLEKKCVPIPTTAPAVLRASWTLLSSPLGWGPATTWPAEEVRAALNRLGWAMMPAVDAPSGETASVSCDCVSFPKAAELVTRALAAGYIRTDKDRQCWRFILARYSPQSSDVIAAWHDLDHVDVKAMVLDDRRERASKAAAAAAARRASH
jgi:hypothetical protein